MKSLTNLFFLKRFLCLKLSYLIFLGNSHLYELSYSLHSYIFNWMVYTVSVLSTCEAVNVKKAVFYSCITVMYNLLLFYYLVEKTMQKNLYKNITKIILTIIIRLIRVQTHRPPFVAERRKWISIVCNTCIHFSFSIFCKKISPQYEYHKKIFFIKVMNIFKSMRWVFFYVQLANL